MTQAELPFTDYRTPPQDRPRLAGQNADLLAALRKGPVTNAQMVEAGMLKYTSRVSALRAVGFKIVCKRLKGGLHEYRLIENSEQS